MSSEKKWCKIWAWKRRYGPAADLPSVQHERRIDARRLTCFLRPFSSSARSLSGTNRRSSGRSKVIDYRWKEPPIYPSRLLIMQLPVQTLSWRKHLVCITAHENPQAKHDRLYLLCCRTYRLQPGFLGLL